jgi:hypothetical protein
VKFTGLGRQLLDKLIIIIIIIIKSNDRIAATMYSLGTWFVSLIYVCINTLHKGDNDEDNNNNGDVHFCTTNNAPVFYFLV